MLLISLAVTMLRVSAPVAGSPEDKPGVDLAAYPELSFDRALPTIANALGSLLNDPGSISNFLGCPTPVKVKFDKGRPKQWTFLLSLNAKNRFGGYVGASGYAAVVKTDGSVKVFSILSPLTDTRGCKRIPDAEIQKLLAG